MPRYSWAATWLCLLRYLSAASVWYPDMICSTVSTWLWHILHLWVDPCLMICLSGIQCLVMSSCDESFSLSFESSILYPLEWHLHIYMIFIQILGKFAMHAFSPSTSPSPVYYTFLVLEFQLLGFPCGCLGKVISYDTSCFSFWYVSLSLRYLSEGP